MRVAALFGALLALLALVSPARAVAPTVTVEPSVVSIGQTVSVNVSGFPDGRAVVVTLCGNQARRGSVDCDLPGSVAFPISRFDDAHITTFPIGTPPVPCPCVVQVTNTPGSDIAYAPISINGFPTAPVVSNKLYQPLALDVQVKRASQNPIAWLRSFVGGPTPYDVKVSVHNRLSEAVDGVKLSSRAGRNATDQSRRVTMPVPATLAAGQTWKYSQRVTLSAPVVGDFFWTTTASGDGALARASNRTDHQPFGLYGLVFVLIGDLAWIGYRRVRKLRTRVVEEYAAPPKVSDPVPGARRAAVPTPEPASPSAESLLARPIKRDA